MSLGVRALPKSNTKVACASLRASLDRYTTIRTFFLRQSNFGHASFERRPELVCKPTWTRSIHTSARLYTQQQANKLNTAKETEDKPKAPTPPPSVNLENYSQFYRRLAMSMPHLTRHTKDDFLGVATGFWQRLRVRFKWFTIKSFRKFNADDISAFVTWFLMSQTLWILVGTTTFFSVIFAIANSLRLQEYVARGISDYLTAETGVTIIFESAIVPKWKDSKISFKNVYISRRPQSSSATSSVRKNRDHLSALGYDVGNHPADHHIGDGEDHPEESAAVEEEDTNYAMFDLTVDSIDVTLSLWRWLDGKGLIQDAVVKGVRGVLDRRHIQWDETLEPALFRHPATPGSFELESLQLEDVLITVYQPGNFRPYTASIFRADIRSFRKQWLFYDFLCAENIVGQFDGCLFSLHKPQSIGRTTEMDSKDGDFGRMSRVRIDGVSIDHLRGSTADDGPVSWITSGKVDAVLDIKFPHDPCEVSLPEILGEIAESISANLVGEQPDPKLDRIPGQRVLARPALMAPEDEAAAARRVRTYDDGSAVHVDESPKVIVDIDLRFRDVKAAVPLFTNDLSYVNNALVRPIVAFMNANRTLVPIHCRVVKDLGDFDGAWTMWETGLMDEISLKIYEALAYHVTQSNMNQRIKTISTWSLQLTVSAVLSTLRHMIDPVMAHYQHSVAV